MTVKELILELQAMPQEATVSRYYNDFPTDVGHIEPTVLHRDGKSLYACYKTAYPDSGWCYHCEDELPTEKGVIIR